MGARIACSMCFAVNYDGLVCTPDAPAKHVESYVCDVYWYAGDCCDVELQERLVWLSVDSRVQLDESQPTCQRQLWRVRVHQ